jgi:hypothetical protein
MCSVGLRRFLFKGTVSRDLDWLTVMWLDRSALGEESLIVFYFYNFALLLRLFIKDKNAVLWRK